MKKSDTAAATGATERGSWWPLAGTLVGGLYLLSFRGASYDDAYIIYRYARRLGAGLGFTYNDGQRILGVTTPLLTLILAPLSWMAELPAAAALLYTATCAAAALLLARRLRGLARMALPFMLLSSPYVVAAMGGELGLLCLLGVAACLAADDGREEVACALAALAVLARPDAGLLLGVVGVALLARTKRVPWRGMAIAAIVLGPWLIYATRFFGSPVPQTLHAKRLQSELGIQVGFLAGTIQSAAGKLRQQPLLGLSDLLAFVGLLSMWRRPGVRLVVAWAVLHGIALHLLSIPYYHWYVVVPAFGVVSLAALGLETLERRAGIVAAAIVVALCLVATVGLGEAHRKSTAKAWKRIYTAFGGYLAEHAPPASRVAHYEVGDLGYYSNLTVIDLVGLVSPIDWGQLEKGNVALPILAQGADYVLLKEGDPALSGRVRERPWFRRCFSPEAWLGNVTLYRRIAPLPPPELYGAAQTLADGSIDGPAERRIVAQTFRCERDLPFAIDIGLGLPEGARHGAVIAQLRRDGAAAPLVAKHLRFDHDAADGLTTFRFAPLRDVAGATLVLELLPEFQAHAGPIVVRVSASDRYPDGKLVVAGVEQPGDLVFRMRHRVSP